MRHESKSIEFKRKEWDRENGMNSRDGEMKEEKRDNKKAIPKTAD